MTQKPFHWENVKNGMGRKSFNYTNDNNSEWLHVKYVVEREIESIAYKNITFNLQMVLKNTYKLLSTRASIFLL